MPEEKRLASSHAFLQSTFMEENVKIKIKMKRLKINIQKNNTRGFGDWNYYKKQIDLFFVYDEKKLRISFFI